MYDQTQQRQQQQSRGGKKEKEKISGHKWYVVYELIHFV
jgi:hypothetical protein